MRRARRQACRWRRWPGYNRCRWRLFEQVDLADRLCEHGLHGGLIVAAGGRTGIEVIRVRLRLVGVLGRAGKRGRAQDQVLGLDPFDRHDRSVVARDLHGVHRADRQTFRGESCVVQPDVVDVQRAGAAGGGARGIADADGQLADGGEIHAGDILEADEPLGPRVGDDGVGPGRMRDDGGLAGLIGHPDVQRLRRIAGDADILDCLERDRRHRPCRWWRRSRRPPC